MPRLRSARSEFTFNILPLRGNLGREHGLPSSFYLPASVEGWMIWLYACLGGSILGDAWKSREAGSLTGPWRR